VPVPHEVHDDVIAGLELVQEAVVGEGRHVVIGGGPRILRRWQRSNEVRFLSRPASLLRLSGKLRRTSSEILLTILTLWAAFHSLLAGRPRLISRSPPPYHAPISLSLTLWSPDPVRPRLWIHRGVTVPPSAVLLPLLLGTPSLLGAIITPLVAIHVLLPKVRMLLLKPLRRIDTREMGNTGG
jgi:hypothetical protein